MAVIPRLAELQKDMTDWRRDLHAHPETAFEEHRTGALIAEKLSSFGLHVDRGLAGTGVVGTLSTDGGAAIGLRADMDALHVREANTFAHRSRHDGKMHACGHDGHMAMLLGAARYLSESRRFKGTVHFIFQPAEENEGGGKAMVEDGLFERFPVRAVYGMHNWPGHPVGRFAVGPGAMMAAYDLFEITISGHGAHAAMPHLGIDPVPVAAEIVTALQTVTSRGTDPLDSAVVSVTRISGGDTWNVIPDTVVLGGTARSFRPEVRDRLQAAVSRIANGVAAAHGADAAVRYERRYPATINDAAEADFAARVAKDVVGADNVVWDPAPSMGAEDFAFMLEQRPGCYVWIGNGPGTDGCMLHNPRYDFNDDILSIGASYWARLVERALPADGD